MKNLKKWVGLFLVAALLLGTISCNGNETKDTWENVKASGKLKIALEGAWAPWNYHDTDDHLTGYDVEVGRKIAEKLGVEAEFYEVEWSGLFAGLDSGRYDIIINGVDVTEEREKKYHFSEPYAYVHTVIITKKGNDTIHTFEDLKGKVTCNSLNSTYMTLAEEFGATVQGVETLEETIDMVLAGRVDATLNSEGSYFDYMEAHPDAEIEIAATYNDASHVSIPIRKGEENRALEEKINEAILALKEDGTLANLSNQFFGKDISKE